MDSQFKHATWSSKSAFLFATVGGAVGLGNVWRFPYIAGENGGGGFVLLYLGFVLLLGLPLVAGEMLLGRRGHQSAVATMATLVRQENASSFWRVIGWLSVFVPLVGLSYYAVVAAWTMDYFGLSIAKAFEGLDSESTQSLFGKRIAQPAYQATLHFIFMLLTVAVVSRGVQGGIERITKIMMPALFVVLVLLVIYNATLDSFGAAASFLFAPDFSEITGRSVLIALGQALFSLAIGVGLMITYGAYMPQTFSLQQSALVICLGDTLIAVLAGLAIFPIVFASGLNPGEGPSLIFITLPVAFGSMPGGQYIGSLFFLLLFFAAFTTAIGMLEPMVSWLSERARGKRPMLTVIAGAATWLLGLGSVFSFGILSDFHPLGIVGIDLNVFSLLDFGIANLLLPLNAFLLAVFVGWILRREAAVEEFGSGANRWMAFWRFSVRYVAPVAIMMVFIDLVSG